MGNSLSACVTTPPDKGNIIDHPNDPENVTDVVKKLIAQHQLTGPNPQLAQRLSSIHQPTDSPQFKRRQQESDSVQQLEEKPSPSASVANDGVWEEKADTKVEVVEQRQKVNVVQTRNSLAPYDGVSRKLAQEFKEQFDALDPRLRMTYTAYSPVLEKLDRRTQAKPIAIDLIGKQWPHLEADSQNPSISHNASEMGEHSVMDLLDDVLGQRSSNPSLFLLSQSKTDLVDLLSSMLYPFLAEAFPLSTDIVKDLLENGLQLKDPSMLPMLQHYMPTRVYANKFLDSIYLDTDNLSIMADTISARRYIFSTENEYDAFAFSVAQVIRCCLDLASWLAVAAQQPTDLDDEGEFQPVCRTPAERKLPFTFEILFHSISKKIVTPLSAIVRLNHQKRICDADFRQDVILLMSLDLSGLQLSHDEWRKFSFICGNYNNIQDLSLAECHLTAEELEEIIPVLQSCQHFQLLNLKLNCFSIYDELTFLTQAPQGLTFLKTLNLSCCEINSTAMEIFLKICVPHLQCLEDLNISYNNLSQLQARHFAKLCLLKLKKLNLRSTKLPRDACSILFESVKRSKLLLSLDISGNALDLDSLRQLASGIAYNASLQELFCECIGMRQNDNCVKVFCKAAMMNRSIQLLDVSDNRLGDEGALIFADLIKWKECLLTVHLNHCQFSFKGVQALLSAANCSHSKLQALYIGSNCATLDMLQSKTIQDLLQQITKQRPFHLTI